ncbi:MAG TPA: ATP-binding protein, partial [bacterium]
ISAGVGYLVGTSVVHWQTNQPLIEMAKALPAIPVVGGLSGAYCYFGTISALHPILTWCSRWLEHPRPTKLVPLGMKFLVINYIFVMAVLCLLHPSAYTLGQVVTEEHLKDRALTQLRLASQRILPTEWQGDQTMVLRKAALAAVLRSASLGENGYVFVIDDDGRILTPHPAGHTQVDDEQFFRFWQHVQPDEGAWVDRVGMHRVVAFLRLAFPPWTIISVSFPDDFATPMQHFVQFSIVPIVVVLIIVVVFGNYFTKGITIPLADLRNAAHAITERGDLTLHVPVSSHDELGELSDSFNRMVDRLRDSKSELEGYNRRLEQSARDLSALNQEMEDLLRVVSHDLRAPLINIQGFSNRLQRVVDDAGKQLESVAAAAQDPGVRAQVDSMRSQVQPRLEESLRFVSKGVEKMDALLSQLLAISRVGRKADPVQRHDLNGIVDDVLAIFDHQLKEQGIEIVRQPLPADVPCRRNEINQVFSNLLSNAINYMGTAAERQIEIGSRLRPDGMLECFVRDTGIGIAPEDQDRIFRTFTRLERVNAPGEGVGLAFVKKVVRLHGGDIRVMSQEGQGSTFAFTLPMTATGEGG